jgi:hypothetical protein
VVIKGVGFVIFAAESSEHRLLTRVYYIPTLRNSTINLGQLDKSGSRVKIKNEVMRIWDRHRRLLAKVTRGINRLYVLNVQIVEPLCLATHREQFCDICVLMKQRRLPFPQQSSFRAKERLKVVHGDLCGPVTLTTPRGRCYFLLLIDDLSRYMWIVVLGSKGEVVNAIGRA